MKVARKPLSIVLAFLMLFTSCSIALTGLTFTAQAAAADYDKLTGATIMDDDGSAMAQIKALITAARTKVTGSNSAQTPAQIAANLGVASAVLGANNYSTYPYSGRTSANTKSGNFTNGSQSDHSSSSNVSYNGVTTGTAVSGSVTVNLKKYLLARTLAQVEPSFDTQYKWTVTVANGTSVSFNDVDTSYDTGGCNSQHITQYRHDWTTYSWQYTSAINGSVTQTNTTAKADLAKIQNFLNTYVDLDLATLLDKSADELEAIRTEGAAVDALKSPYDSEVWDHFFGAGSMTKFDNFYASLNTVIQAKGLKAPVTALGEQETAFDALTGGKTYADLTADEAETLGTIFAAADSAFSSIQAIENSSTSTVDAAFELVRSAYAGEDYLSDSSAANEAATYARIRAFYYQRSIFDEINDANAYLDMRAPEVQGMLDDIIAANQAEIEAGQTDEPNAEDPTPRIDAEEYALLEGTIVAADNYISALNALKATAPAQFTEQNGDAVIAALSTLSNNADTAMKASGGEGVYQNYFNDVGRDLWIDMNYYSNTKATERYTYVAGAPRYTDVDGNVVEAVSGQVTEIAAAYNSLKNDVGATYADAIFQVVYKGRTVLLQNALGSYNTNDQNTYLGALKANIIARNSAQIDNVVQTWNNNYNNQINFDNFSVIEGAVSAFDQDLYNYCKYRSWLRSNDESTTAGFQTYLDKVDEFKATGGTSVFHQHHNHDGNGVFTTRYASQGEYITDVARGKDSSNDDYVVTETKVNQTITKLDKFIKSDDFTQTLQLDKVEDKDEEGNVIWSQDVHGISEYIEVLLTHKVFTNNIINTVVGLLFPMLTDLLGGLLSDLQSLAPDYIGAPQWGSTKAVGYLKGSAIHSSVSGGINLYVDNASETIRVDGDDYSVGSTPTIPQLFSSIGANIYPNTFASYLQGRNATKYARIITELNRAGRNWTYFDGKDGSEPDGKVSGKELGYIENGEFKPFDWGVSTVSGQEYNTFITAMGDVFGSTEKILRTLLCGQNFSASLSNAIYVIGELKISILDPDVTGYLKGADINIQGVNIYRDVWVPIMEALGVDQGSYNLPSTISSKISYGSTTGGRYNFRALSTNNESASNMVRALFEPLLVLIGQVCDMPITKLTSLLPNLMYFLSMNKLQDLLNQIDLNISVRLDISNLKSLLHGGFSLVGSIVNAFIKDYTLDVPTQNLGNLVTLKTMLPFDLTNINALIKYIIDAVGVDLTVPTIDAGKVIQSGSLGTYNSALNGKSYYRVNGDKADVFYIILDYISRALGNRELVDGIVALIDEEGRGLPSIVYNVLDSLNGHPEDIIAALVELFVPNENGDGSSKYATFGYDWYQAPDGGTGAASVVYITDANANSGNNYYGKKWTRKTATTVVNNITDMINDILKASGSDIEIPSFNESAAEAIKNIFTNRGIASPLRGITSLSHDLMEKDEEGNATTEEGAIAGIIRREIGVDIASWYRNYGSIFQTIELESVTETGDITTITAPPEELYGQSVTVSKDGHTLEIGVAEIVDLPDEEGDGTHKGFIVDGEEITDGGNYWFKYDGQLMTTGDHDLFLKIFTFAFGEFAPALGLILSGQDLGLFEDALVLKGFKGYRTGLYPVLNVLGVEGLPTPDEYEAAVALNADGTVNSAAHEEQFANIAEALVSFVVGLFEDENGQPVNTVEKILELVPRIVYLIESNALSTSLKNILMPVLVLIDTIRPIANADINTTVAVLLEEFLQESTDADGNLRPFDISVFTDKKYPVQENGFPVEKSFLEMILATLLGVWNGETIETHYSINVDDLTLENILTTVDQIMGTKLASSQLIAYGVPNLVRGLQYSDNFDVARNADGTIDRTQSPDAADVLTILISTILESFITEVEEGKSNGSIVCAWIDKYFPISIGDETLKLEEIFNAITEIINTEVIADAEYSVPDWLYMYGELDPEAVIPGDYAGSLANVVANNKATNSTVYLDYKTNWSKATAELADSQLENLLNLVLQPGDDGNILTKMLNDILEGNVYTPDVFTGLVSMVYDATSGINASIFELAGTVLGIDVNTFLTSYAQTEIDPDTGDEVYVKNENGAYVFDEAKLLAAIGDVSNREGFTTAFKTVLEPLNDLLAWFLFGEDYGFFTGSKLKDDGTFEYNTIISIAGGKGYDYAIVYLLEMLGFEMNVEGLASDSYAAATNVKKAEFYHNADGTWRVSEALSDILDAVLGGLDEIAADPVNNVMDLLLNFIYFVNADGVATVIQNVLAPFDAVLKAVSPVVGTLPIDQLENIDLSSVLNLLKSVLPAETKEKIAEYGIDLDSIDSWEGLISWPTIVELLKATTGIVIPDAVAELLADFYLGSLEAYESANGEESMRMVFNGAETDGDRADFITIILSMVLETLVYADNEEPIVALLTNAGIENAQGIYDAIITLYTGHELTAEDYNKPNWDYLDEGAGANDYVYDALESWVADFTAANLPGRDATGEYSCVYLQYNTDWTTEAADAIMGNAATLVDKILVLMGEDSTLGEMLRKIIDDNVYGNASILGELVETVAEAIANLGITIEESTGLESTTLFDAVKETLGVDVAAWLDKCDIVYGTETDDDDVTHKTVESVSIKEPITATKDNFGDVLAEILAPLYAGEKNIINWLFFGGSYTFFNDTNKHPIITLNGGFGYDYALLYLLEALGVQNLKLGKDNYYTIETVEETDGSTRRVISSTTEQTKQFIKDLGNGIAARLDEIAGDPVNLVVELLPNLIYFIGADGASVAVSNLIKPVTSLLALANNAVGKELVDLNDLLGKVGLSYDAANDQINIGWTEIFALLENLAGITVPQEVEDAITKLYVGELKAEHHLSETETEGYVTMKATDATAKGDILTVLISAVGDVLKAEENKDAVIKLLGDDEAAAEKYDAIMAILDGIDVGAYETPDWAYLENGYNFLENPDAPKYPDSALYTNSAVYLQYKNNWAAETADTLDKELNRLANTILGSIEAVEGDSLAAILKGLLEGNVYQTKVLRGMVKGVYGLIADLDADIIKAVGAVLAPEITTWLDTYGDLVDGKYVYSQEKAHAAIKDINADNFAANLNTIISPLEGVLGWLLFGKDYTFFNSYKPNEVLVTVKGGLGYANGLAYILEALGCENLPAGDATAHDAIPAILDSVVARLNDLATDEENATSLDKILALLPELIYFINAKGLGTVVDNLLNPAAALIEAVAPFVDAIDSDKTGTAVVIGFLKDTVNDALGIELIDDDTASFRELLTLENVLTIVKEKIGLSFKPEVADLLTSFYIGKLEKIAPTVAASQGYKMAYGDEIIKGSRGDMITIVISILLDTFEYEENRDFLLNYLTETQYEAIKALYKPADYSGKYITPDWDYLAGDEDYSDNLAQYVIDYQPVINSNRASCVYLTYGNDWGTQEDISKLVASLDTLIDYILKDVAKQGSVKELVQGVLASYVFGTEEKDCVLNTLIAMVAKLVKPFESYINIADATLGTEIATWLDKCDYVYADDGTIEEAILKEDAKITGVTDENFGAKLAEALQPINPVLDWFLFGGNLKFFYDAGDGEDQIYLAGGEGFNNALIYLFEALGVEIDAAAYTNADNSVDVSKAIEELGTKLIDRIYEICDAPVKGVLEVLPNVLYFLGANGVGTILNNLLVPVNGILNIVNSFVPADSQISIEGLAQQYLGVDLDPAKLNLDAIFALIEEAAGITIPDFDKNVIKEVLIGSLAVKASANGTDTVTLKAVTAEDRADFLTAVLSIAASIVKAEENKDAMINLLGSEDNYNAVFDILDGKVQIAYEAPDWGYMDPDYAYDIANLDNQAVPQYPADELLYNYYNKYWTGDQNNWNQETAEYIVNNLTDIANIVLEKFVDKEGYGSLAEIVTNLLNDNLYSSDNFDSVLKSVYNAVAGIDHTVLDAVGILFDADVAAWLEAYGTQDAEGKYVYTEGRTWAVANADEFTATLIEVLDPLDRLVEWLFLGKEYKFLYNADGTDLLTIKGGEGYGNALVYLLEALGVDGLAKRYELDNADDMEETVIRQLLARAEGICADPANELIALIPNIIYFINTNGLGAVVDNLVAPLDALVKAAAPFYGDAAGGVLGLLKGTLEDNVKNLDLTDKTAFIEVLTMDNILKIVNGYTGITVPEATTFVLENFYIGKLESIDSANHHTAFRMVYSDEQVDPAVMVTVLIGIVADIAKGEGNSDAIKALLGEDNAKYMEAVDNILDLANKTIDYTKYNWLYIMTGEGYNEGDIVSATGNSSKYSDPYANQNYWTPEMAAEVADHLDRFVGNLMCLLGLEINGKHIESLDQIIKDLIKEKVYTQSNIDAILNLLQNRVIANIKEQLGEELWNHLVTIIKDALNVDLAAYENMTIDVEVTDAASFKAALDQILTPVLPLLNVVLCGESLDFFYYADGADVITIPGAEGYKYSIIPLLEALSIDQNDIATVEDFKAAMAIACAKDASEADKNAVVNMILDPIMNKLDAVAEDPVNEIKAMLPAAVYFINSEGLNTVFNNIVASLDAVLEAVEPITGQKMTVQGLAFKDDEALKDYNFEYLIGMILNRINGDLGTTLKPVINDFVTELTTGVIKQYESKNGDTTFQDYYTMVYAIEGKDGEGVEGTTADMLTVVLRILVDFITDDNNLEQIKNLLKNYITDEKTYGYVCSLIDALKGARKDDPSFAKALYILYKAYVGVEKAVDAVDLAKHDANNTWAFIFKMMESSNDPALNSLYKTLNDFFKKYFSGDVISVDVDPDRDGEPGVVAPNGFIKFFQALAAFFQKIINFFKGLFGG